MASSGTGVPFWKEPQFVFGIILLAAWLFFLYPVLVNVHTYDPNSQRPEPLESAQGISALFSTALGFVWGHYFGKTGAAAAARDSIQPNIKDQEREIKDFVEGLA